MERMSTVFAIAGLLVLTACARHNPPAMPAGPPSAEEVEILAVMDAYMHEISRNDLAAKEARQTPEGMTYRHRARPDGSWEVLPRSNMQYGKVTHCGIDAFSLSKIDGEWKISNAMWTVEPQACEELRPADPGLMRPR